MSTFRHVNVSSMSPRAHSARNTGISRFKSLRKHTRILRRKQRGNCVPTCRYCPPSSVTRVIIHMNTKMILAAVALSLSLAACAKKEEPARGCPGSPLQRRAKLPARLRMLLVTRRSAGDAAAAAGDAAAAGRDAACRPAAGPAAAVIELLSHSVIDAVSTSDSSSSGYRAGVSARCPAERSLPTGGEP